MRHAEIFIREALVHGQLDTEAEFMRHNQRLRKDVEEALEHKSRRRDVLVDDTHIFAFYDALVPREVWSSQQFERWRREAERNDAKVLFLSRQHLMRHAAEDITEERFPLSLELNGVRYALSYRFEPGHALDGVTMTVPLHLLNQVDERRCEWLVPGLLREKVTQLIRGLPKNLRKHFVPVPQMVTAALERMEPASAPLPDALSEALLAATGAVVPADAWPVVELPAFLRMNYQVVDDHGHELAMGRDIAELREQLGVKARRHFSETAANRFERKGLVTFDLEELPEQVEFHRAGQTLIGYPALVDEGKSVALTLLDTEHDAEVATHRALRRLFQLAAADQVKFVARNLPGFQELALRYSLLLEVEGGKTDKSAVSERLRDELLKRSAIAHSSSRTSVVRTKAAFNARVAKAKSRLNDVAREEVCRVVADILAEYVELRPRESARRAGVAAGDDRHPQSAQGAAAARLHRCDAAGAAQGVPALRQGHRDAFGQVLGQSGQRCAMAAGDPELVAGVAGAHGRRCAAWRVRAAH